MRRNIYFKINLCSFLSAILLFFSFVVYGQQILEDLDRGVVAVRTVGSEVFISWRLLRDDPDTIAFNVYRDGIKINQAPTNYTNFVDNTSTNAVYTIKAVIDGVEQEASAGAQTWDKPYKTIPLQRPEGGTTPDGVSYTYSPNDISVGDLNGDGSYEIVLKWDPSNSKDNSQNGYTGNVYIDAYELDGTQLWRIDLGKNIRAGAHYTQFIVYDLDSDGKAEVAFKTADGTIDGQGQVIGDASADYRNTAGRILSGPEYLTVFNGETGAAMATTDYLPARGNVSDWGDNYGNRVDRFLAGVGYFDGTHPSLLMTRGYYTRSVLVAWDWQNGQLSHRWTFDSNDPGNEGYGGQGNHQLTIADVDEDGKDEIIFGSMAVDNDGTGLYTTRLGHGDAMHISDLDPSRPGLESWTAQEDVSAYEGNGLWFRDARTGEKIWGVPADRDIGRALAADIDPRYEGFEVWGGTGGLYTNKGEKITDTRPSMNFAIWWDADLQRELLDGTSIDKWNPNTNSTNRILSADLYGAASINGTKANPNLSADILGDWREEIIYRSNDNNNLILFTSTRYTTNRLTTLMHDRQYRLSIAWQNVGYNQPPHTSSYFGNLNADPGEYYVEPVTDVSGPVLENISVYPNPSGSSFQLELQGSFTFAIYDQLGRLMERGSGINKIELGEKLKPGIYVLKVEADKGRKIKRLVKQ